MFYESFSWEVSVKLGFGRNRTHIRNNMLLLVESTSSTMANNKEVSNKSFRFYESSMFHEARH